MGSSAESNLLLYLQVHGWRRTSPTACIWPRKKLKKAKVGESASSCLLCVSLTQRSPETKPQSLAGKLESGALTEAGSEKYQSSPSQPQRPPQGAPTGSREISKTCFPSYSQGEQNGLQIKELMWCTEERATPETVTGKDRSGGPDRGPPISDSLTSKAHLLLPPLKASAPASLDVLGKKSKNFLLQPGEKALSVEKDECMGGTCKLKTVDGKEELRPIELAKHLKVNYTQPFPAPVARTSLLTNPKRCCLHFSLLPDRNLVCPPNANEVRCLTTLELLQKEGVQSYKAKFKAKEPRPPMNTKKCILKEAKQENRPQTLETSVFPRPLLPSLRASRVVIPVSTHRLL